MKTFSERLLELLAGPHEPRQGLQRLLDGVVPAVTAPEDDQVALAHTVHSLLQEMQAHKEEFLDAIEKPYGIPWSDQFRIIKEEVFDTWAEIVRERWVGRNADERVHALASIIRVGQGYRRIEPVESAGES